MIRDDKQVSGYIRMEQNKGLIGIYEKENSNSVWHDECPWEYENWLFEADYRGEMAAITGRPRTAVSRS